MDVAPGNTLCYEKSSSSFLSVCFNLVLEKIKNPHLTFNIFISLTTFSLPFLDVQSQFETAQYVTMSLPCTFGIWDMT